MKTDLDRKYDHLEALARELRVPIPIGRVKLEVFMDGRVVETREFRSRSWVRNAYNLMVAQLGAKDIDDTTFGAGKMSFKDVAGATAYDADDCTYMGYTDKSLDTEAYGYHAPADSDTFGILVGSGTTAESFEGYVLATKIVSGNGAGELAYGATAEPALTYTAGTKLMEIAWVRYFNNNSGGAISVNELALVARVTVGVTHATYVLMARDKLGAAVSVPDTGQLKVTYTIGVTYPA